MPWDILNGAATNHQLTFPEGEQKVSAIGYDRMAPRYLLKTATDNITVYNFLLCMACQIDMPCDLLDEAATNH